MHVIARVAVFGECLLMSNEGADCSKNDVRRPLLSPVAAEAVAGAFAGLSGVVFGHPLDTVRVRLQQPGATSLRRVLADTVRLGGFSALFAGVSAPLFTSSLQNAVCFKAYASTSRALATSPASPLIVSFLSGAVAGAATTILVTPVDLIKCQLQVRTVPGGPGVFALATSILRAEGPRGLFRGAGVTLLRDVLSTGVYFCCYDAASAAVLAMTGGAEGAHASAALTLGAGGFAGVMSWLSIYPLDVVKSRLQAQPGRWDGMVDCFRESLRAEGAAVFSRGLGACLTRAFIVNAAIFGGYEGAMKLLSA